MISHASMCNRKVVKQKTYTNIVVAATGCKTAFAALDVSLEMCRIYWRVVVMPVYYEGIGFHDFGARRGAWIFRGWVASERL